MSKTSCLTHTACMQKKLLLSSKRKTLQSTIIKKKLKEIFSKKPKVDTKGAMDILDNSKVSSSYRPVHYYLNKMKENNYFLLASNNFYT